MTACQPAIARLSPLRVNHDKAFTDQGHLWRRYLPQRVASRRIELPATGSPGLQGAIPFAIVVRKGGVYFGEPFNVHCDGFDHTDRIAVAVCDDAEGANFRQWLVRGLVRPQ